MRLLVAPIVVLAWLLAPALARADEWELTQPSPRAKAPRRAKADSARSAESAPQDVLRQRYLRVLLADPGQVLALERLLALYRERDGHLEGLLAELGTRTPETAALWLVRGHALAASGQPDGARAAYARAAELDSRSILPLTAQAELARSAGDLAQAAELYGRALAHAPRGGRADLLLTLGELALERQDFEGAARHYAERAQALSGSVHASTELARALLARGEVDRALSAYDAALTSLAGDNRVLGPVLVEKARAELEATRNEQALTTLERARALLPKGSGARAEHAELEVEAHRRLGRLRELALRLGAERSPDFDTLLRVGRLHDELGDPQAALASLRRALQKNARSLETRQLVIRILTRQGELPEAVEEYRALVRHSPGEPRHVVELAELLMQTGRRQEALSLLAQTARRHARDARTQKALFHAYSRWNEPQLAQRTLAQLTLIEPSDPSHWVALGEQALEQGDQAGALAAWRRITALGVDKAAAHAALGDTLLDHDMPERALPEYEQAVRLSKDSPEHVRGLAETLERLQRNTEAAQLWQALLDRPDLDRNQRREARRRVVRAWALTGELPRKIAELERAFGMNAEGSRASGAKPDLESGRFLAEAYRGLSTGRRASRGDSRHIDAADRVLQRVLEIDPGDVESLQALERSRMLRGDLAGAITALERLLEADPRGAAGYLTRMAEHALALYRDDDALAYAERLVALTPNDAKAYERLGALYRARQDSARAITSYERATELDPNAFGVLCELAELLLAHGKLEAADRALRRVLVGSPDDELVKRAARSLLQLDAGSEHLRSLERVLLPLALGHPQRPLYRRVLVELYDAVSRPWLEAVRSGGPEAEPARGELTALGQRAIKPLLEALADPDPAQRGIAIDLLGELRNEHAALPLLSVAEREGDTLLRRRALLGAGAVARDNLAPRLLALAQAPERRLRDAAAWALARMEGEGANAALKTLVASTAPSVRGYALLGLATRSDAGSQTVLRAALRDDRHAFVRGSAALGLGMRADRESISALGAALRAEHGEPSVAAAVALASLPEPAAVSALCEAVFAGDPALREAALWSLRWAASGARPRAPALPEPDERSELAPLIASWLAQTPPGSVADAVAAHAAELHVAASTALRGAPDSTRLALRLLAGTDPLLSSPPLEALLASLLDALRPLSAHPDPVVRAGALGLLARAQAQTAQGSLVTALQDQDARVQSAALAAASGVAQVTDPQVLAGLSQVADHDSRWWMRLRAVTALGQGNEQAAAALARVLSRDPYAYVRAAAAQALGRLGLAVSGPALRRALEDSEPAVREAAARALQAISDRN